jgi:hypothetical protein
MALTCKSKPQIISCYKQLHNLALLAKIHAMKNSKKKRKKKKVDFFEKDITIQIQYRQH